MSPHQRQTVRNPYLRSLRWRRFEVPSTLRFGATSDQAHPILDPIFHRRVWLTMAPKVMAPRTSTAQYTSECTRYLEK